MLSRTFRTQSPKVDPGEAGVVLPPLPKPEPSSSSLNFSFGRVTTELRGLVFSLQFIPLPPTQRFVRACFAGLCETRALLCKRFCPFSHGHVTCKVILLLIIEMIFFFFTLPHFTLYSEKRPHMAVSHINVGLNSYLNSGKVTCCKMVLTMFSCKSPSDILFCIPFLVSGLCCCFVDVFPHPGRSERTGSCSEKPPSQVEKIRD